MASFFDKSRANVDGAEKLKADLNSYGIAA